MPSSYVTHIKCTEVDTLPLTEPNWNYWILELHAPGILPYFSQCLTKSEAGSTPRTLFWPTMIIVHFGASGKCTAIMDVPNLACTELDLPHTSVHCSASVVIYSWIKCSLGLITGKTTIISTSQIEFCRFSASINV